MAVQRERKDDEIDPVVDVGAHRISKDPEENHVPDQVHQAAVQQDVPQKSGHGEAPQNQ